MKVHRRGASSPSLLLEASEPPTSVNVNGNYYQFELEPHHVERGKRGQKVFVCDLCPAPGGVFKRSFSLKRHYLRFHINFAFLSPRDLNNCAIAVAGQHQRSGFPPTGPNDRLINRLNNSSPLLFRCHQCGRLLRTKNDLLKHLEAHPGPSQTVTEENGDGQQGGTNRCPRCSTAFSLRKTLMRHIKKNRCRGGNPPPPLPDIPDTHSKPESETGIQSGGTSDPGDDYLAMGPEEENEEMDMEASLRLGSPTSLFRFACTLCNKMFNSYVNMCRHRRLAHGRYGICSPHWLLSRKLSNKPSLKHAVQSPINSSRNPQIFHDLSHIVTNANDNLNRFIDGKRNNIRSLAPTDDRFEVQPTDSGNPPPERWSWGETSYNATELQKLDVPLQMAYYYGLKSLKLQETAKTQSSSSQSAPEEMDISKVLNLRKTVETSSQEKVTAISQPEFSGEWIRSKNYICSPCGEIFQDFLALLDHQQNGHSGVSCTHIQLDQSTEAELADELKRQIMRSGNGGQILPLDTFQCTKCHFSVESIPELHSHILLCSNHVSASPYRKRRVKVNPRSRRGHWNQNEAPNGGSRGLQRTNSSLTKNSSAARSLRSRSPKEDATDKGTPGALRRSTRRVLSFSEPAPTKKKNGITKRILRQRVDPLLINGSAVSKSVQIEVKKKNGVSVNSKSTSKITVDVHECDGCQKQFQSHTSVLKHKHYCPKKSNESSAVPNNATTPVSSKNQSNGLSKAQTKILAYETVKTEPNLKRSNTKRKSEVLSTSPIKKPKVTVPSDTKGIPSSNSNSPKKTSRKSVSSATPTQVSLAKTPAKPKSTSKSIAGSAKSNRSTTKKGNEEIEEIAVAAEGRPVRSSRRVSMTLAMEDQVEASFLEALSPEQRVRVAEQKCPFCSKHYVYRSNFKRHLLEGCDTIDVDEPSVNLTPTNNKKPSDDKINKEKKSSVSSSSVLKAERKDKRQTIESDLKKVENKPLKKKKAEEIPEGKIKKTVEKKSNKTPHSPISKSSKLQELKKSTETRSRKEAVKLTPSPSNQKAKQIHSKKTQNKIEIAKQNRNGKPSAREEENMNNVTKVRGEENITKNSDKFDLPKRNGRKPTAAPKSKKSNSPSLSADIVKLVEDEAGCSDQDKELHSNNGVDHQLEKTANQTQGDDQIGKSTFTEKDREPECNHLKMDGSKILNGNCGSNRALRSSTTSKYDLNKSHALDRLKLGQALDNAISEIFKSYTYFTKYPIQIRRLKNLAQAYLQPTSY